MTSPRRPNEPVRGIGSNQHQDKRAATTSTSAAATTTGKQAGDVADQDPFGAALSWSDVQAEYGLDDEAIVEWEDCNFDADHAKEWMDATFDNPEMAYSWSEYFEPDQACRWHAALVEPSLSSGHSHVPAEVASQWRDRGFSPDEAAAWTEAGVGPGEADTPTEGPRVVLADEEMPPGTPPEWSGTCVTAANGVPFNVRLVPAGSKYGAGFKLDADTTMVEFYDSRHHPNPEVHGASAAHGQFVSRYNLDTLCEGSPDVGLDLYGGSNDWKVDADTLALVKTWATNKMGGSNE